MKVKELLSYRDNLYSAQSRNLSQFEKNFLYITGAMLAFSITFIQEIVDIHDAIRLLLLFISWGLIILSIGIIMFTFLSSASASDKIWAVMNTFIVDNNLYNSEDELTDRQAKDIREKINKILTRHKGLLKTLRYTAIFSFIAGIILLALFVSQNLLRENRNPPPQSTAELSFDKASKSIYFYDAQKEYHEGSSRNRS